jgi:hypothetical protein
VLTYARHVLLPLQQGRQQGACHVTGEIRCSSGAASPAHAAAGAWHVIALAAIALGSGTGQAAGAAADYRPSAHTYAPVLQRQCSIWLLCTVVQCRVAVLSCTTQRCIAVPASNECFPGGVLTRVRPPAWPRLPVVAWLTRPSMCVSSMSTATSCSSRLSGYTAPCGSSTQHAHENHGRFTAHS